MQIGRRCRQYGCCYLGNCCNTGSYCKLNLKHEIQTEPFQITSLYKAYRIHSLVAACTKLCLSAQSAYLWMGTSNHNQNNYKHSTLKLLLIKHHYFLFCHGKLITSCFAMGSSLLPVLPWVAHYFLFPKCIY